MEDLDIVNGWVCGRCNAEIISFDRKETLFICPNCGCEFNMDDSHINPICAIEVNSRECDYCIVKNLEVKFRFSGNNVFKFKDKLYLHIPTVATTKDFGKLYAISSNTTDLELITYLKGIN